MLDVRRKAEILRPSRRIKVWLAYKMSQYIPTVFTDCRSDEFIIRNVEGYRRETIVRYAKGGKLDGELELHIDVNGRLFYHELKPNPSRTAIPINELRVNVTKMEHAVNCEGHTAERPSSIYSASPSVFKVIIGEKGAYSIFDPIPFEQKTPDSSLNVNFQPTDDDQVQLPEHEEFLQRILGIKTKQFPSNVLFFRSRERKENIKFPFQAAVWLESQSDAVPVPLRTFLLVFIGLCGVVLPFVLLAVPQPWWDRWDRSLFMSGYFLGLLSFRELLVSEGYAMTNVLKGFVRPDKLSKMASALGISVRELLFLARMGGSWTTNLDTSQLSFLGLYGGGNIRRDEWKEMNQYALENESFNKQFMLTRNGVGTIFGSSAQKGGKLNHNVEERGVMAPPFVDFDECKHYLS